MELFSIPQDDSLIGSPTRSASFSAITEDESNNQVEEIANLYLFSKSIQQELSDELALKMDLSPIAPLQSDSRDSDDDITQESMAIFDESYAVATYQEIESRVSAFCSPYRTPQKIQSFHRNAPDHGFTPMTLTQLLESDTPTSGLDDFFHALTALRSPRKVSVTSVLTPTPKSSHRPPRRLPTRSKSKPEPDFFSSAFGGDSDSDVYTSSDEEDLRLGANAVDANGSDVLNVVSMRIHDISPDAERGMREVLSTESLRRNWDLEELVVGSLDKIAKAEGNLKKEISQRYAEQYQRTFSRDGPVEMDHDYKVELLTEAGRQAAIEDEIGRKKSNRSTPRQMMKESQASKEITTISEENDWETIDSNDLSAVTIAADSKRKQILTNHLTGFDDRMKGDFSLWKSINKVILWSDMKDRYAGLSDCVPGNGIAGFDCLCVMECVLRPDIELKRIMAAVLRASHALSCSFRLNSRSHAVIMSSQSVLTSPTASSMSSTGNVFSGSIASAFGSKNNASSSSIISDEEWDVLDIQICISKELRQRVLVGIFLRRFQRLNRSNNSNNTMNNKSFTSNMKLPISRVTTTIQSLLVSSRLCLSSLYHATISSVCQGGRLDGHFEAQIQTLFRESMWTNLHEAFLAMDEYCKQVETTAMATEQTLEPIYKQHGIVGNGNGNINMPRLNIEELRMESTLKISNMINSSSSITTPLTIATIDGNMIDTRKISNKSKQSIDNDPNQSIMSMNESSDKLGLSRLEISQMTNNSSQQHDSHESYSDDDTNRDIDQEFEDGMAKCLHIVTNHFSELQAKFDVEFAARLQRKHDSTFNMIDSITAFRQMLLKTIATNPIAQNSALTKAYKTALNGIIPTKSLIPATDTTNPIKRLSKSWTMLPSSNTANHTASNGQNVNTSKNISTSKGLSIATNNSTLLPSNEPSPTSPSFQPTSERAKSTAMLVKQHLEAFRKTIDDDVQIASVVSIQQARQLTPPPQHDSPIESNPIIYDVVLYYCTCLVNGTPGTIYLTPFYVALTSGWVAALSPLHRELLPLKDLDAISLPTHSSIMSMSLPSNSLKLAFFHGKKEVVITPLVVDASKMRVILADAAAAFGSMANR